MDTRYLQYTSGWDGEKLVLPNKAYTTAANFAAFAASDADGNFGIFKPDGTLVTALLSAGDKVFFAVKRDGIVSKTTIINYVTTGAVTPPLLITKTVGTTGVSQVTTVVITCGGTVDCSDPASCCTSPLQNYFFGIIDPQTSDRPQRETWEYNLQGRYNRTISQLLVAMRTLVNDTNSVMNTVRGRKVNMSAITTGGGATSADPSTYTFTLTGLDTKPFQFMYKGFGNVSVTLTTVAVEPIGTVKTMKEIEFEGLVRNGWESKYIGWPFISAEWGEPTMFSNSTASPTFTQYMFREHRTEDSNVSGIERHFRSHLIEIAVPTGSALETKMNTVFAQ